MPTLTPVVRKLLLWNVGIFLVSVLLSFQSTAFGLLLDYLSLNPHMWGPNPPFLPVWQLVTYGFLHSVSSLGHIAFNMLGLYFFGTLLEELVGGSRMLVAYFGAMIVGGILHLLTSMIGVPHEAIGASGAVLGIIVATAVLRPNTPVIFLIFPMTLKVLAMLLVAMDAFMVLVIMRDHSNAGVAHWVHLGGALFGYVWAKQGWIWIDFPERFAKAKVQRARDQLLEDEQQMDQLLARIQRDGIASLSAKEREFLKRMSERKR